MKDRPATELEEDLILLSIALDLAVTCLEKITGRNKDKWLSTIEAEAIKAFATILPEEIPRMIRNRKI